ncbi:FHA domain-containing protein [Tundrisphaera lichenicola]|uniref:FHA domain-containing protein n=1 Tax=Tundrisphaera lichenicola TaxID=2029860 RepID=UPI003EBA83BA
MSKSWTIGSHPTSDLVMPPPASDRHARLTIGPGGAILEDLGSASGTFVHRVRITGAILVSRADTITIGPDLPMPWPPEPADLGPVVLTIGREPDNDLVVNLPTVSGHHARVIWSGKPGEAVIEDLNSSNGTALNSPDRKAERAVVTSSDTVYLGTAPISGASILGKVDPSVGRVLTPGGADLIIGRAPECGKVVDEPSVSGRHARLSRAGGRVTIEDLNSSNGTFVNGRRIESPTTVEPGDVIGLGLYMMRIAPVPASAPSRSARTVIEPIPRATIETPVSASTSPAPARAPWPIVLPSALLLQGPVAALLILGAVGGGFSTPEAVAGLVFGLGLAATWFGLSDAVILENLGPGSTGETAFPARLGVLALVCVGQCLLAWAIVSRVAGLRGPGMASIGFLVLASLVGAALGLLIVALAPRRDLSWAALPVALAAFWLFGGGPRTLPRNFPWAWTVASASPSRWAFEGLLLMETERAGPNDLAQPYFPAETTRMGPRADVLALGTMLVGLSVSVVFLTRPSSRDS